MDIARWLIPGANGQSATYPRTVLSLGGRFGYRDQGQTANTQISVMDFGDTQLIDGLVKVWDLAEVSGDRRR